jgi:hypothetical protein
LVVILGDIAARIERERVEKEALEEIKTETDTVSA